MYIRSRNYTTLLFLIEVFIEIVVDSYAVVSSNAERSPYSLLSFPVGNIVQNYRIISQLAINIDTVHPSCSEDFPCFT